MNAVNAFLNPIISMLRELIAIWHWFSNLFALINLLELMSQHGSFAGLVLWLISSAVSSFLAEVLKSKIPTLLRLILREIGL